MLFLIDVPYRLTLHRIHFNAITSNASLLSAIEEARAVTKDRLKSMKDTIGFNLAGLRHMKHDLEEAGGSAYALKTRY